MISFNADSYLSSMSDDLKNLLTSHSSFTTGGLAQNRRASVAQNDGLRVGKDGRDVETAGASDVQEVGVGRLHQSFQFVRAGFRSSRGVEQVHSKLFL
jgi:hypothetical protein